MPGNVDKKRKASKDAKSTEVSTEETDAPDTCPAQPKTIELAVSMAVRGSPTDVFEAWLDSKAAGSPWFGVAKAIVNPSVDGLFYHLVQFGGREWAHYGRFITIDKPHKIQHTWVSPATEGLETVLTLTFDLDGDTTVVKLNHANVPDNAMGRQHEQGWQFCLQALADRFAGSSERKDESAKPGESTEPNDGSLASKDGTIESSDDSKNQGEPTQPTEETMKATDEQTKPMDDTTKPIEEPSKAKDKPTKSKQEPSKTKEPESKKAKVDKSKPKEKASGKKDSK